MVMSGEHRLADHAPWDLSTHIVTSEAMDLPFRNSCHHMQLCAIIADILWGAAADKFIHCKRQDPLPTIMTAEVSRRLESTQAAQVVDKRRGVYTTHLAVGAWTLVA